MSGARPSAPTWAQPRGGPPAEGSALDQQMAAFVGPRWARYRRKFGPFFDDPRFQPTWNWPAAVTIPFGGLWFLYRKLYIPFVFFTVLPSLAFSFLWGDGAVPLHTVPNPAVPGGPGLPVFAPGAFPLLGGVILSTMILAGGTANFLLYRRASAAIQLVAPRTPDLGAQLPLLRRVGGVSWASVAIGLVLSLAFSYFNATGSRG